MGNTDYFEYYNKFPTGIIITDIELKILFCNEEIFLLTGYNRAEVEGKNLSIFNFYSNEPEKKSINIKNCIKNNKLQNTMFIKDTKNNYLIVFLNSKEIIDKDKNTINIISVTNITNITQCEFYINQIAEKNALDKMIGKNTKFLELLKMIRLAADSVANVLIIGESGTGKELMAKAIHELSDRKKEPFITVNCSSLSETLLESELFGHIKGSFTGAYKDKIGLFESAQGGTIFLDEIGDISPLIQVKLLRVIQEKTIARVGDNKEIKVNMRIITATNKNLRDLINKGLFREDLFYRLNVFPIHTIPLRERSNDIPFLCDYFIKKFNASTGKNIVSFTENAFRLVMDYCWPGNIRELENCIEHAFVICNNQFIDIFDLPHDLRLVAVRDGICKERNQISNNDNSINDIKKSKSRNTISKETLINILKDSNWNKAETARQLNISRTALWKKIKKFDIQRN